MATTRTWVGGAQATNMVQTITVGSNTDTDTFIISISHPSGAGLESVQIASDTASSDTTASIAAELYAQLSASTHEFARRVAWSYPGTGAVITATAAFAGEPFIIDKSGTGTLTIATTQANTGPFDWNTAGNWAEGVVPIDDDDVTLQGAYDIRFGLNQSDIELDTLNVVNYSGVVGSRGLPLTIDVAEEMLFDYSGQVSLRQATAGCGYIVVHRTGGRDYGLALSGLTGANPESTVMEVRSGNVLIGLTRAEKVTITTLRNIDGTVTVFDGSVATNIHQSGTGHMVNLNDGNTITLLRVDGGTMICHSPVTTVTQNGGVYDWRENNIGTYNLNAGVLETRRSRAARTVTTLNQAQAGFFRRDSATVTVTTHATEGPMEIRGIGDAGL